MSLSLLALAAKLNDRMKCGDISKEDAEVRRFYYSLNLADSKRLAEQMPMPPKEADFANEPAGVQAAYPGPGGAALWAADRKQQIVLAANQMVDAVTVVESQIKVDAVMAAADRTDATTVKAVCVAKATAVSAAQVAEIGD